MTKKQRPDELSQFIDDMSKENDTLIIDALAKLEDHATRGKLKPTVATIVELTGLARNTIRNRDWALIRLKDIKKNDRIKLAEVDKSDVFAVVEKSVEDSLSVKIKVLTEQNVLLFNEVLTLQQANTKLRREMEAVQAARLRLV
jgi:hypothetical protein